MDACLARLFHGEREILGGQAAFLACARGRKSGYQRRKVFSHSSSSTWVLICRKRCAPRWLHPICCFFTIRFTPSNPAHSVRGPKYVVKKGKTPVGVAKTPKRC